MSLDSERPLHEDHRMIDWDAVGVEASSLLSVYLKIKSINPPGDERAAAAFLVSQLKQRVAEPGVLAATADRPNVVARLPGNGSKKPVLVYHHMDVVEADPEKWSCDPFSGEIRDGYVWGRGAIDMKGMGIMQLLALELLRQHDPDRSRDIIFLAAADEEKGGALGTRWLIENHWPEVEAEYVWDEGGFGLKDMFGPQAVFTVAIAEKKELWLRLAARGEPGHSGMPHGENAAEILLAALVRVLSLDTQYRVSKVPAMMFRAIAPSMPFPVSFLFKHLDVPLIFSMLKKTLISSATISAMLRDTLSVTVLNAGSKENIIPDRAEAVLDIRLLPDIAPQDFLVTLRNLITDVRVDIEVLQFPQEGMATSVDTDFYRVLSAVLKNRVPSGVVAPMLTPGTTDSAFFRQKGVHCYGLFPAVISPDELARFHGIDERISINNLVLGTRIFYETLRGLTRKSA